MKIKLNAEYMLLSIDGLRISSFPKGFEISDAYYDNRDERFFNFEYNNYSYKITNNLATIITDSGIQNTMNIKEKFVLALTKEPHKSFRKVGITNGDDILTEDGSKVFLSWLLHNKFAEEFKTAVVDEMVKDLEEEKSV